MNASVSARSAKHSSATVDHYTPVRIVDAARTALGGSIDLDPASCGFANRVVRALEYFDADGLSRPWTGRVFLNPPGGQDRSAQFGTRSRQSQWWAKLCAEWASGRVESAVFVGFSLELAQVCQITVAPHPLAFPFCVPKQRICFDARARELVARLRQEISRLPSLHPRALDAWERIEELGDAAEADERVAGDQPTHGNLIVFLPRSRGWDEQDTAGFFGAFREIGFCRT